MTPTRMDILDHVGEAFADGPATRDDLLAVAEATGADDAAFVQLRRLPAQRYRDVQPQLP